MQSEMMKKYSLLILIDMVVLLFCCVLLPVKYSFLFICLYLGLRGIGTTIWLKKWFIPSLMCITTLLFVYLCVTGFNFTGVFNLRLTNFLFLTLPVIIVIAVSLITRFVMFLISLITS